MRRFLPRLTSTPAKFHCGADEVLTVPGQRGVKPRGGEGWFGYSTRGRPLSGTAGECPRPGDLWLGHGRQV
jgi:hypothetical protein